VDYLGMASGKDEDKLAAVGLTPVKSVLVDAPYIREFPLVLECKVIHVTEIGLHTQFIGEILDVKAEESILDDKGATSIKKARPFIYSPDDRNYYGIGDLVAKGFEVGKKSSP
ncbi:MAG TPA: flavin reductase family protein, partial [Methanomassiliicoccales archaeon]|nr:flavin reductase family protein [Methanomassiliicoccales archaeon]